MTVAPCAARARAVSTPRPAETPVTRMRLPLRLIPSRTSSVVDVAPNSLTIIQFLLLQLCRSGERLLSLLRCLIRSALEISGPVKIGNKRGVNRLPAQMFLRELAGGWIIDGKEMCDPAEVLIGLFARFGNHRHVEPAADHFSNLARRHALVGSSVIADACCAFFYGEPVEFGCIQPMHGRPAITTVINI